MRERSKLVDTAVELDSVYTYTCESDTIGFMSEPQSFTGVQRMIDVLTPGYFALVRAGKVLPNNACRIEYPIAVTVRTPGSVQYKLNDYPEFQRIAGDLCFNHIDGCFGGFPDVPALPALAESSLGNFVALDAFADARQEAFDALTFLAEFRECADMVASATRNMLKRLSRLSTIKGTALTIAELWLEYRYGWSPLVSDLKSIRDLIASLNQRVILIHGRSRSVDILSSSSYVSPARATWKWPSLGMGNACFAEISRSTTTARTFRATSLVGLESLEKISFDPIITGWEIIPFSFVIDWLVNVQTNLLALSPFQLGRDLGTSLVQEVTSSILLTSTTPVPVGGSVGNWQCIESRRSTLGFEQRTYNRVPYTPELELTFQNPIANVKHIFDSLALSRQEIFKLLRRFNH